MRFLILFAIILTALDLTAQAKVPYIFRVQEKRVSKHVHKYLRHDTIIETQLAKTHIHYSNDDSKPYLLLIHGMGVDAKTNWHHQVADLSKQYNLLMPDLVYFGKSVAKEENYSVEFQAVQIHEALKILNLQGKLYIMGFSYGGLVAAMYNQLYPQDVKKLIIMDGPVKFFSVQMADSFALMAGAKSMTNIIVPQNIQDFNAMQKAVISKKYPFTRSLKKKMIRHYFSPTLLPRQLQLSYLTTHQAIYQNYTYNLNTTPTLLVWGKKDGVVPLCVGEKLHKEFPATTQLIVFKNAKHDCHFSYSKELNKEVLKFLGN